MENPIGIKHHMASLTPPICWSFEELQHQLCSAFVWIQTAPTRKNPDTFLTRRRQQVSPAASPPCLSSDKGKMPMTSSPCACSPPPYARSFCILHYTAPSQNYPNYLNLLFNSNLIWNGDQSSMFLISFYVNGWVGNIVQTL